MNSTTRRRVPLPRVLALLALLALVTFAGATACSSSDSGADSDSGASSSTAEGDMSAPDAGGGVVDQADPAAASDLPAQGAPADSFDAKTDTVDTENAVELDRALIKQGNVALLSTDVAHAHIEVQKIVDRYAGHVSEEETQAAKSGEPEYTRMVLRIPTDDFDNAMAALKKVDKLESVNSNETDVTAKVIDVHTRVQAQRRSIARITVLFERAENIRDIMSIEAELSRRQADLESLERTQAQLASQTSMSTITVSIEAEHHQAATKKKHDDTGFLAGLASGWDGLKRFATVVATLVGVLLPWAFVVALVGVPTLLLVRSLRRRTPQVVAEATGDGQASE